VLPARASSHNGLASRLVLAGITWREGTFADPQDWEVAAVAWPDREYYDGGFGPEPDLVEQGTCAGCGVEVMSSAKVAICPVCGTRCQLT